MRPWVTSLEFEGIVHRTRNGAKNATASKLREATQSPTLTAATKVRQHTGQVGPNSLRGFWDRPAEPSLEGRRKKGGPKPFLSKAERWQTLICLSVRIHHAELVQSAARQTSMRIGSCDPGREVGPLLLSRVIVVSITCWCPC
jgi:hypothetical protein